MLNCALRLFKLPSCSCSCLRLFCISFFSVRILSLYCVITESVAAICFLYSSALMSPSRNCLAKSFWLAFNSSIFAVNCAIPLIASL